MSAKITDLTLGTVVDGVADFIPWVDVSDTTMHACGTTKKLAPNSLPVSTATAAAIADKQATLVSNVNIKTVGGLTILGPGDIPVGLGDALVANPLSQFAATSSQMENCLLVLPVQRHGQ